MTTTAMALPTTPTITATTAVTTTRIAWVGTTTIKSQSLLSS